MIPERNNMAITIMVREDTATGNQTGAIHGTGIRNRTSVVFKEGGHFIRIYNET